MGTMHTVFIKELAFGVAIDANVGIEAQYLATPEVVALTLSQAKMALFSSTGNKALERRLIPEPVSKGRVVDLIAVIDTYSMALLRLAGGCGQWERGQEGNIGFA